MFGNKSRRVLHIKIGTQTYAAKLEDADIHTMQATLPQGTPTVRVQFLNSNIIGIGTPYTSVAAVA
jgi:hypothetical protein